MGCGSSKSPGTADFPELDEFPVAESEPGYPPPKPPKSRKEECFNPPDYITIDSNAKKVPDSKTTSYETLIGEITKGLTTDLQKLRAVYSWLGNQEIESQIYQNVTDNSTPKGYMKNIKHKKGTFTEFFALLCRAAKLPCVILNGHGKSASYEVGDRDFSDLNSRWNAVFVDGSWRFVHALWSFRAITGFNKGNLREIEREGKAVNTKQAKSAGTDITHVNEYYFLTNPDEFIFKCRPNQDVWQLLASPWSMDKYTSVPYCHPQFFTSGLQIVSKNNCVIKSEKGKCWIEFEHDESLKLTLEYKLFYNETASGAELPKDRRLDMYVAYNNQITRRGYLVRFPSIGVYKIVVSNFCEFRLECDELGEYVEEFPIKPSIGYGYGKTAQENGIISASQQYGFINLKCNEKKLFNFDIPDSANIKTECIAGGNNKDQLTLNINQIITENNISYEVTMPDTIGDFVFQLIKDSETVINYLISTDQVVQGGVKGQPQKKEPVREVLIQVTRGSDIQRLESAIDLFEQNGLEDKGDLTRAKDKLQDLYYAHGKNSSDQENELRIRTRLQVATSEDDIDELEAAIEEFIANRLEDDGDLTKAKQRLLELYINALQRATSHRNVDKLEYVIERAQSSRVCGSLKYSQVMLDAEETLRQLQRLRKFMTRILAMKQSTVSEITSYKRPKPCIHDVMKATYIILGEKEKRLNSWNHIQTLTRKFGKESLIRRIKEFDVINLKLPTANRSDRLLTEYDDLTVRQNSAGAGTFFKWSYNMIEEVQDNDPRSRTA